MDSPAINRAIDAAAEAGGGTVYFPAGTYLSFTIHLRSHVTLQLDQGCTVLAADPDEAEGSYDLPESNDWDMYQDFGHSHWRNSLIHGEGLEDIAIVGPGRIYGKGLTRRGPGPRRPSQPGDVPLSLNDARGTNIAVNPGGERRRGGGRRGMDGLGILAIGLKLCRNVLLRDITILQAGHFALLATGVDNLTIDNVKVDTNRDGFDIDACRHVRISNCSVNSPNDDAIVLKSSFALGRARATENVTIMNCQVSGYDMGTFLDGTFGRTQERAPDREGVCGRIKFGTESNGGFKNITIANCVFERCRGLALETVDGGLLEDVTISNITMRDIVNAPIFLRLGARMRGPEGVPPGKLRRVSINNVNVFNADPDYASIIAGMSGHDIEDVTISNVRIITRGGGTKEQAQRELPENDSAYPEPSMFGVTPSHGFLVRHARGIEFNTVAVSSLEEDLRPAFLLEDVRRAELRNVRMEPAEGVNSVVLKRVAGFTARDCHPIRDVELKRIVSRAY